MSEDFKRAYDVKSSESQKAHVGAASQVYAALQAGKPDIAQQILAEKVAAYRNSGMEEDAKGYETFANLIKESPEVATTTAGLFLANALGPDKFTEDFSKLEGERRDKALEPSKVTEAEANAQKAATAAKFAESDAALDLQKKGWDIKKLQNDIDVSKLNSKIAMINAQLARDNNQMQHDKLSMDLDKFTRERNDYVNGKVADIQSARSNIDNMLNTIDRIVSTPDDTKRAALGTIDATLPTLQNDVADFERLVENAGAQAFLAQIPNIKGMGALSSAEGEKLQAALQSFSLKQSPERFNANMVEAQRLMNKARDNLATRYGMPNTIADRPAAPMPASNEINNLLKKYGGQ